MKKGFYYLLLVFVAVALSCKSIQPQSPNTVTQTPADPFTNNDNISTPVTPNDDSPQPLEAESAIAWATFLKETTENTNDAVVRSIKKDVDGNIYILFGQKDGNANGVWTLSLAKSDRNGNPVWQIPVIKNTVPYSSMELDSQGNIYVAGDYFSDENDKTAHPIASETTWKEPINPFKSDPHGISNKNAFIVKFDTNGAIVWNTFVNIFSASAIAMDDKNNILISGGSTNLDGTTLIKLNNEGSIQWSKIYAPADGAATPAEPYSIKLGKSGDIYISGGSSYPSWGNPTGELAGTHFEAKFQSDGTLLWNTFLGGDTGVATQMDVDNVGNVYTFGVSSKSWGNPLNPFTDVSDGYDQYIAKLDSNGNILWNTFVGSPIAISAITVDLNGNPYIVGSSSSAWGNPSHAYTGNKDGFIAQFDQNGSLLWNTFIGGTGNDKITFFNVVSDTEIYIAGASDSTFTSPLMTNLLSGNDGKGGIFIIATSMEALR
jgi:hypothetical protein